MEREGKLGRRGAHRRGQTALPKIAAPWDAPGQVQERHARREARLRLSGGETGGGGG